MVQDRDRHHQKLLMQIVIGAAWADGHLEPGEVSYLEKLLHRYGLEDNEDLQELLTIPVSLEITLNRILNYLQETSESERHRAVVAMANLFIADDQVTDIEHQMLDEFHRLMGKIPPQPEPQGNTTASPSASPNGDHHDWLQSLGRWVKRAIAP